MVTKQDLYVNVLGYFIGSMTAPKHPFTPDQVADFTVTAAMKALDFDHPNEFKRYVVSAADYWGVDISKAVSYINSNPAAAYIFIEYAKQNITVTGYSLQEILENMFSWIGKTVGGSLSSLLGGFIGKFIPIAIIMFGGYILFKQAKKKYA